MATWKKVVVESAADTIAQDTTGSAATLTTGRTIALSGEVSATGVSFDGSANITISGTALGADVVGNDELDLVTGNSAVDGYILSYDSATGGGDLKWIAASANANDATITLSPGAGIGTLGDFTTNQSSNETITIGVDGVLEDLDTLGAPASDGQFIVATGAGAFAYESGATVRTSLGLGTGDSPTFTDLTLSGDLTVNGTTTTINTTNLEVEDQFVLLNNAASATDADAGIVIEGSTKTVAFGYDQSADRFAFDKAGATSNMTTIGNDAYFVHAHTAAGDSTNADSDFAQYGNIYVDSSSQDIYIYS